jgi:hypothetical protein
MNMKNRRHPAARLRLMLLTGLCFALRFASEAHAITIYNFSINTSALSGQQGLLAFDLIGGDGAVANNTAIVNNFSTNGVLDQPGQAVTLTDSLFFNEELKAITFGSFLSFTLQLTENHTAPGFDQFSFFVLDAVSFLPLFGTTDSTGADALFAIDITGAAGGSGGAFISTGQNISWSLARDTNGGSNNVPDGASTLCLLLVSLGTLGFGRSGFRRDWSS